jgi:hypothetical protein
VKVIAFKSEVTYERVLSILKRASQEAGKVNIGGALLREVFVSLEELIQGSVTEVNTDDILLVYGMKRKEN